VSRAPRSARRAPPPGPSLGPWGSISRGSPDLAEIMLESAGPLATRAPRVFDHQGAHFRGRFHAVSLLSVVPGPAPLYPKDKGRARVTGYEGARFGYVTGSVRT